MPRTIEFEDDALVVRLTGLVHYEALTSELRIPYAAIESVSAEPFEPPKGTQEIFGTHVPFTDIREGRFQYRGEWYFLSLEDRHKAITLRLNGYHHGGRPEPLRVVVLGTRDPAELAAAIDKIRSERKDPGAGAGPKP
jgi:hypothetical protein